MSLGWGKIGDRYTLTYDDCQQPYLHWCERLKDFCQLFGDPTFEIICSPFSDMHIILFIIPFYSKPNSFLSKDAEILMSSLPAFDSMIPSAAASPAPSFTKPASLYSATASVPRDPPSPQWTDKSPPPMTSFNPVFPQPITKRFSSSHYLPATTPSRHPTIIKSRNFLRSPSKSPHPGNGITFIPMPTYSDPGHGISYSTAHK